MHVLRQPNTVPRPVGAMLLGPERLLSCSALCVASLASATSRCGRHWWLRLLHGIVNHWRMRKVRGQGPVANVQWPRRPPRCSMPTASCKELMLSCPISPSPSHLFPWRTDPFPFPFPAYESFPSLPPAPNTEELLSRRVCVCDQNHQRLFALCSLFFALNLFC